MDILPEGVIYAKDRQIYPLAYPKLQLQPETCELTVIVFGERKNIACAEIPDDAEVIEVEDVSGRSFNRAMEQAHGRFVALCQDGDIVTPERFAIQLQDDADLSLSPIESEQEHPAWSIRGYTQEADRPSNQLSTMMFRRSIFEELEGAHPDMTDGFDYDLYVRLVSDHRFEIAYHADTLVSRELFLEDGAVYTQQVYNDAVNRVRYTKDYHAPSIRARGLDERILAAARPPYTEAD